MDSLLACVPYSALRAACLYVICTVVTNGTNSAEVVSQCPYTLLITRKVNVTST
jgi:hypothetical protein